MKNKFSIFEKISLTLAIVNILLLIVGIFICYVWDNDIGIYLMLPSVIQFGISGLLIILFEVVLCEIWGLDLHVFPTLFKGV